jgi:16S rRNA (adenine1518-N6/adenine1519-N6)-dimethyltransferase
MGLPETKRLLRTFRIVPNKLLGQNFMVEPAFYAKLSEYACLRKADVVLDAGAGFGFFSSYLADRCKAVVAVEKDPRIAAVLREHLGNCSNVTVIEGDMLKTELPEFDKVVSIPPYYLSSRLIAWLVERKTLCSVLILQREFADKLVAPVGSDNYGWLTVIVSQEGQAELLDVVPKSVFYPVPEVDSVIVRLTRRPARFKVYDKALFKTLVKWLFTQRNRKICNALPPFLRNTRKLDKETARKLASACPFSDRRTRELSPREFGELANALRA